MKLKTRHLHGNILIQANGTTLQGIFKKHDSWNSDTFSTRYQTIGQAKRDTAVKARAGYFGEVFKAVEHPHRTNIRSLAREARTTAARRGHSLKPFRFTEHGNKITATTTCGKCGMQVDLDTYPAPNGIDISGEAVALNCEKV